MLFLYLNRLDTWSLNKIPKSPVRVLDKLDRSNLLCVC